MAKLGFGVCLIAEWKSFSQTWPYGFGSWVDFKFTIYIFHCKIYRCSFCVESPYASLHGKFIERESRERPKKDAKAKESRIGGGAEAEIRRMMAEQRTELFSLQERENFHLTVSHSENQRRIQSPNGKPSLTIKKTLRVVAQPSFVWIRPRLSGFKRRMIFFSSSEKCGIFLKSTRGSSSLRME